MPGHLPDRRRLRDGGRRRRLIGIKPRAFDASDLAAVAPWFDDPETRRWLGDRAWAERLLKLAAASADRFALLFCDGEDPVALLDVDLFRDGRTGVAVVVAPDARRRGIGTAALAGVVGRVEVFGGVEQGNVAGERLLRRAGFAQVTDAPDPDGFTYFARRAGGRPPARPWQRPEA